MNENWAKPAHYSSLKEGETKKKWDPFFFVYIDIIKISLAKIHMLKSDILYWLKSTLLTYTTLKHYQWNADKTDNLAGYNRSNQV